MISRCSSFESDLDDEPVMLKFWSMLTDKCPVLEESRPFPSKSPFRRSLFVDHDDFRILNCERGGEDQRKEKKRKRVVDATGSGRKCGGRYGSESTMSSSSNKVNSTASGTAPERHVT